MPADPIILGSARSHGIADADIQHAYRNAKFVEEAADGMLMLVGPATDGTLLEVGVEHASDYPEVLFIKHAMKVRKKFLPTKPRRKR